MIGSIDAGISKNGNLVRSGIARPSTVINFLKKSGKPDDFEVVWWKDGLPVRENGMRYIENHQNGL